MPALFVFLLKVNAALLLFCMGYYLVLRPLTFYTLNRVYLVIAIIFSTLYPLVNLTRFIERHEEIKQPVQTIILILKAPAGHIVKPDYWHWAAIVIWAGAVLFAIRLLVQLTSLYKLYKKSTPGKIQEHNVRLVNANISPFSFWQSIYINPANIAPTDLENVLQHEQIHITEWHTLDILLTEISVIFYWFNPGVWLMKKAVRENIEFITDRQILQKGIDSKAYQYSLLNVSFAAQAPVGIANHFNFSTLKKRIVMMNAKRSSKFNLTRYAVLVPIVIVLLLVFSFSKATLLKKSKNAYKPVVNSLNHITTTNYTNAKITAVESVKKRKQIKSTINVKTVDTNKKLMFKDSVTYFIDGKKSSATEVELMNHDDIKTINVSKSPQSNGVVSIQTKPLTNDSIGNKPVTYTAKVAELRRKMEGMEVVSDGTLRHNGKLVSTESRPNLFTDKLILVDGKEDSESDKIPSNKIKSIKLKDANAADIVKYGDKAKNGIVLITLKK